METNRTVAEREPAKLNEVSALDARRTHHRLVELLLTTAIVVMRAAPNAVRGSVLPAAERADVGAIDDAGVVGVSRPRRRLPDGAWSAGWRGGRQGGAAVMITRR
jgi:hypothetical protein